MLYYYALPLFLFLTLSLRIISIRVQNEKKFFPKNYTFKTTFDISDTRHFILIPLFQGVFGDTILKKWKRHNKSSMRRRQRNLRLWNK